MTSNVWLASSLWTRKKLLVEHKHTTKDNNEREDICEIVFPKLHTHTQADIESLVAGEQSYCRGELIYCKDEKIFPDIKSSLYLQLNLYRKILSAK